MADPLDSVLIKARRYVENGERLIARQRMLLDELDRDSCPSTAAMARAVLATLEASLALTREYLKREWEKAKGKS
jgi:hypothetical protein